MANLNRNAIEKARQEYGVVCQLIPNANPNNISKIIVQGYEFSCSTWVYEDAENFFAWVSKCDKKEIKKHSEYLASSERELQLWDTIDMNMSVNSLQSVLNYMVDNSITLDTYNACKTLDLSAEQYSILDDRVVLNWTLKNAIKTWVKYNGLNVSASMLEKFLITWSEHDYNKQLSNEVLSDLLTVV